MQYVEVTRRFDAPPARVWAIYTDHARWSEWSGLGPSSLATAGRPERDGVGAVRRLGAGPLRVWEEVVEFDAPKRMAYRVVRGGFPIANHFGEVAFEPDGGGTRIVWRCRFESRVPGLGAPLRALVTRMFRSALEGLARRLEAG